MTDEKWKTRPDPRARTHPDLDFGTFTNATGLVQKEPPSLEELAETQRRIEALFRPSLAEASLRQAAEHAFMYIERIVPLPGTRTLFGVPAMRVRIPCIANIHCPPSGLYSMHEGTTMIVMGSPSAWGEQGAHHMAEAYRPELPC